MLQEYLNEDKELYISEDRPVKIINMTPHDVTFYDANGRSINFKPSGKVLRTRRTPSVIDNLKIEQNGELFEIPIVETVHEFTENILPPYQRGVYYIVSSFYADAFPERNDLLIPNTGTNPTVGAVRDEKNRVTGTRSLRVGNRYRKNRE